MKRFYRTKIGVILFFVELFLPVCRLTAQTMLPDSLSAQAMLPESLSTQTRLQDSLMAQVMLQDSYTAQTLLYDSDTVQAMLPDSLTNQATLPDSLVRERIQVIQRMLNEGKRNANTWWYGWLIGYGAATVAQSVVAITSNNLVTRQDMVLGAFTTLLGMGGQVIAPMVPGYAPAKLEVIREGTAEENIMKLREAEKWLELSAKREKDGRSWKTHALDGAVNIGSGLMVWFGFKRTFLDGLENLAINTAICEAQIFTQPTRAIKDYKTYCSRYKTDQDLSLNEPKASWSFTMMPGGLGFRLTF